MDQIRRVMRPTDVPDSGSIFINFCIFLLSSEFSLLLVVVHVSLAGLLCDLLWSDPDKDTQGWGENDRGVSFTFGGEIVGKFLHKHDMDLICRAHQVCRLRSPCL